MTSALTVEVFFDLICPWCYVGKRHLATALERVHAQRPEVIIDVEWRSLPLMPFTPAEGEPFDDFYLRRLGSVDAVASRRAQVKEAAGRAGLAVAFERIERLPNTLAAHLLIHAARGDATQQAALIDRLFAAYFCEGEDIGDTMVLDRLARESGIAAEGTGHTDRSDENPIFQWLTSAERQGVSGVPAFVIDGGRAVSGAVAPDVLVARLLAAADARVTY